MCYLLLSAPRNCTKEFGGNGCNHSAGTTRLAGAIHLSLAYVHARQDDIPWARQADAVAISALEKLLIQLNRRPSLLM